MYCHGIRSFNLICEQPSGRATAASGFGGCDLPYPINTEASWREAAFRERFESAECRYLPDVVERVIDDTRLGSALMLVEIRLQLLFGFLSVSYKFPPRPEC
jgi:hypothetical protein